MKMNKNQFFSALVSGKIKNFKINGQKFYSKLLERDFYVDMAMVKPLDKATKKLITSMMEILKSNADNILKRNADVFLKSVTNTDYEIFNQSTNIEEFNKISNKFKSFLNSFNINDYLCLVGSPYGEQDITIRIAKKSDKNFARIKLSIRLRRYWMIEDIFINIALPEDNTKHYSVGFYPSNSNKDSIKKLIFNAVKNYLGTKIIEEN